MLSIAVLIEIIIFLLIVIVKVVNHYEEKIKEKNKENSESHEYGEIPLKCPGGWKNCPGTDSDGEIFPDHYAVSDGGAEGDGI